MSSKYTCDDPVVVSSGAFMHDCNKKDCYYCYYMNRPEKVQKPKRKNGWFEWEIQMLKDHYNKVDNEYIELLLNKKSRIAIWQKAFELKLTNQRIISS